MTKDIALIIGIDTYHNSEMSDLNGAVRDAESIEKWLREHRPNIEIFRLSSDKDSVSLDNVKDEFLKIIKECLKKDGHSYRRLIFYFSGHGYSDFYEDGHFMTQEGHLPTGVTKYEEFISAYSAKSLHDAFFHSHLFDEILFIQDCCRVQYLEGRVTPMDLESYLFQCDSKKINLQRSVFGFACTFGGEAKEIEDINGVDRGQFTLAIEHIIAKNSKNENFTTLDIKDGIKGLMPNQEPEFKEFKNHSLSLWNKRNTKRYRCRIEEKVLVKGKVKNFRIKRANPQDASDLYVDFKDTIELHPLIYVVEFNLGKREYRGFIDVSEKQIRFNTEISTMLEVYYDNSSI